jgi:predicted Rossmann fold nucleotide-binding protein DprA/Smf involved in DNA uptake
VREDREAWLAALFSGRSVDDVARSFGLSTADILARLAMLELDGRVVRLPGQRYAPGGSPL